MKIKKLSFWKKAAIGAVTTVAGIAGRASAETKPVEKPLEPVKQTAPINVTSKTDYFSKYIYRGFKFSDDPVVQENILVNYKGLTAWLFGNHNAKTKDIDEQDLILDFTTPINEKKDLLFSTGWGVYTFPNTDMKKTQEVYAGITLENERFLNPSLFLFHDFKDGRGNYIEGAISTNIKEVDLSAKLGYNNHYYRDRSGFSHLELSAGVPIKLRKNLTLIPSINYQEALDKDFEDESWARLSLKYEF